MAATLHNQRPPFLDTGAFRLCRLELSTPHLLHPSSHTPPPCALKCSREPLPSPSPAAPSAQHPPAHPSSRRRAPPAARTHSTHTQLSFVQRTLPAAPPRSVCVPNHAPIICGKWHLVSLRIIAFVFPRRRRRRRREARARTHSPPFTPSLLFRLSHATASLEKHCVTIIILLACCAGTVGRCDRRAKARDGGRSRFFFTRGRRSA